MILKNEFTVQAPVDRVWALLDDLERVVPSMPGASYLGREAGDEHRVAIKLKVGVIATHFQGRVRFAQKDPVRHTARIEGSGKDTGGKASASAAILVNLEDFAGQATRVLLETDLALTGKLAQFGSGVIEDISARIISQFAENLHRAVEVSPPQAAPPASPPPTPQPAAFDVGHAMAPIARKLAWRYLLVPAIAFIAGWLACRFFH
ncbi:MAG TPA: SRPBCC family protein [Ramlibacter sp.]|uniref:SRPBCC family protein n=1 Tax=Ramlibacter sp. TaxID=1917967 RepID=UPI002BF2B597|nr:SRPBCC family protein [Ramlibacter sp.]HVZ42201.1 SRPBCC family protein [Ramlibacter sp.]